MSPRQKNLLTLAKIGLGQDAVFDEIYQRISIDDYVDGPVADDKGRPGNIWIFGMTISEVNCYLKFQEKNNNVIFWISIHEAEYPLKFPFK